MTVSYAAEVASCKGFGCFWRLLFRWRGSIYRLLWPNLTAYVVCYFILSLVYRLALSDSQKRSFEKVSNYCEAFSDFIPVTFILGFYISIVLKRWWDQFMALPWPDALAMFVSTCIHGQDDRGRLMRRTIMRYANLSFVMTIGSISTVVKLRFPTLDHLVDAGILLPNEKKILEDLDEKMPKYPKYFIPLVWAASIITRARKEGRVRDDFAVKTMIDELSSFRGKCGDLFIYDWMSIPLVYTQVVTLAVYTFFLATIMGRQYLEPGKSLKHTNIDLFVPIFTILQFIFYMGWLKVAESLINPFGEDDDDFEMNWMVDRNLQISYLIVDEMHQEHPELIKDQYWDEVMPPELPYTIASEHYKCEPPMGSAADLSVPDHEAEFVPMETVVEERDAENCQDEFPGHLSAASSHSSVSGRSTSRPHSVRRGVVVSMFQRLFNMQQGSGYIGSNQSITNSQRQKGLHIGSKSNSPQFGSVRSATSQNRQTVMADKLQTRGNTTTPVPRMNWRESLYGEQEQVKNMKNAIRSATFENGNREDERLESQSNTPIGLPIEVCTPTKLQIRGKNSKTNLESTHCSGGASIGAQMQFLNVPSGSINQFSFTSSSVSCLPNNSIKMSSSMPNFLSASTNSSTTDDSKTGQSRSNRFHSPCSAPFNNSSK